MNFSCLCLPTKWKLSGYSNTLDRNHSATYDYQLSAVNPVIIGRQFPSHAKEEGWPLKIISGVDVRAFALFLINPDKL